MYALVYHDLRYYVIVDKNDTHQLMGGECLESESSITAMRRHLKEQAGVEATMINDCIDMNREILNLEPFYDGKLMFYAEVDSLPSGQGGYKLASFASMHQLAIMTNNSKFIMDAMSRFNTSILYLFGDCDKQPMPQQV